MNNMDKETVIRIAEEHHLAITIRPDGSIIGLDYDLALLRLLYEATLAGKKASK